MIEDPAYPAGTNTLEHSETVRIWFGLLAVWSSLAQVPILLASSGRDGTGACAIQPKESVSRFPRSAPYSPQLSFLWPVAVGSTLVYRELLGANRSLVHSPLEFFYHLIV